MSELFLKPWIPPLLQAAVSLEAWMALATRDSNCFLDGNWTKTDVTISVAGKVELTTWLKLLVVCLVVSSGRVDSLTWFLVSWSNRLIYNVSPTRMKPIRHEKAKRSLQQDQDKIELSREEKEPGAGSQLSLYHLLAKQNRRSASKALFQLLQHILQSN